ncbi:hypothetical protein [Mycobacterium sp. 236(2023)]|uniref:hypothetical protein n=1 Tax=Mycobacterium sp. 236(2023) TaxID=3038163 RepID=UPI0024157271|nr:hypothetical protein [Mycobacterium sp. 236(2023)]MDG4663025.1 hypothetical protein [Mycobacterium sp. 236(2023)]
MPLSSSARPTLADAVGRYAAHTGNPRVRAVEARLRAPRSVAVLGRSGVGCTAVARGLAGSGVRIVTSGADVHVLVVAEALKAEDQRDLGAGPTVIVLNKADLSGRVPGGPLAEAGRIAGRIAAASGCPVVPTIAHLAAVDVDEEMAAALRTLAVTPADMTSVDAFVAAPHVVPGPVRRRLLERLDRFGIAHAVLAVADGADGAQVAARLRALSQVDAAVARIGEFDAEVEYRRGCSALAGLRRVAAETRDDELASFLVSDQVVSAVMTSAANVMEAAGVRVDLGDGLRSAVRWRHYADGPLNALHRRCAADISRGLLRSQQ